MICFQLRTRELETLDEARAFMSGLTLGYKCIALVCVIGALTTVAKGKIIAGPGGGGRVSTRADVLRAKRVYSTVEDPYEEPVPAHVPEKIPPQKPLVIPERARAPRKNCSELGWSTQVRDKGRKKEFHALIHSRNRLRLYALFLRSTRSEARFALAIFMGFR